MEPITPCDCDERGSLTQGNATCDHALELCYYIISLPLHEWGAHPDCTNRQCQCKANVDGPNCNRCQLGFFGLSANNPEGCNRCWCSGVTDQCGDANLHWSTLRVNMDPVGSRGVKLTNK